MDMTDAGEAAFGAVGVSIVFDKLLKVFLN